MKEKLTNSKAISITLILAFLVVGAFLAYNQSLTTSGKFLAKHFYNIPMETISIKKFERKTGDVISEKVLNAEEATELAHYIHKADFKHIKSSTVPFKSETGYLILGEGEKGNQLFYMDSYGDEFVTGFLAYPDKPSKDFKLKILNKDWISKMESFLKE